jgi:RNAse (barnase) inhibitor barstar
VVHEYTIDGSRITSLDAFYDEVSRVLIPGQRWGRNLDSFDDILCGWFSTPADGFMIRWSQAEYSRKMLSPGLFDQLVEIIRDHGPGGEQAEHNVQLLLD